MISAPDANAEAVVASDAEISGHPVLPGVTALTGFDLQPFQTTFRVPELADPYVTQLENSVVVSGTAQYLLEFKSLESIARGGPYRIVWNDFYYADGTPMEGERFFAHSWDMKPVAWVLSPPGQKSSPRLWDPVRDKATGVRPKVVWYGGHMRPAHGAKVSRWPEDNYSRDVFAFEEKESSRWLSRPESIFANRKNWPRPKGDFLGHRYGHQIVMVPKLVKSRTRMVPAVFYEEVTAVRADGLPAVTKIFMDEMTSPFRTRGRPVELVSPISGATGRPLPSSIREDGSVLFEGPIYFRFKFQGELWEAIGFSSGSYYGKYPASFASRRVKDGLRGHPFEIDLDDRGRDLHDAGASLGRVMNLAGGPGRPAVMVSSNGRALLDAKGRLQVLVHGYRRDILPDADYERPPLKYRFEQMYRVVLHAFLEVTKRPDGKLRFNISVDDKQSPSWPSSTTTEPLTKPN